MFKKIGVLQDELFNTSDEVLVCSFWGEGCQKTCAKKLLWTFHNLFLTPLFWGFFRMGFVPSCKGECSVGTQGVDPMLWHTPSCVRSWMTVVWFHMCHPTKKAGALFGCFSCVSVLELSTLLITASRCALLACCENLYQHLSAVWVGI